MKLHVHKLKHLFYIMPLFGCYGLVAFALIGCATVGPPGFVPVRAGGNTYQSSLFSVRLPEGDGWYQMARSDGSLHLTKETGERTHTFFVSVIPVAVQPDWENPNEFMVSAKKQKDLNSNPKRFKFLKNDYVLDNRFGEYSFRYHAKAEDHGVPGLPSDEFLILDMHGYGFQHPQEKRLYFDVNYSERYLPGRADPALAQIGEKFISSFQFTEIKATETP